MKLCPLTSIDNLLNCNCDFTSSIKLLLLSRHFVHYGFANVIFFLLLLFLACTITLTDWLSGVMQMGKGMSPDPRWPTYQRSNFHCLFNISRNFFQTNNVQITYNFDMSCVNIWMYKFTCFIIYLINCTEHKFKISIYYFIYMNRKISVAATINWLDI